MVSFKCQCCDSTNAEIVHLVLCKSCNHVEYIKEGKKVITERNYKKLAEIQKVPKLD